MKLKKNNYRLTVLYPVLFKRNSTDGLSIITARIGNIIDVLGHSV